MFLDSADADKPVSKSKKRKDAKKAKQAEVHVTEQTFRYSK